MCDEELGKDWFDHCNKHTKLITYKETKKNAVPEPSMETTVPTLKG